MPGHEAYCTLITIGRRPTQSRQQKAQTNGNRYNKQGKYPIFALVKTLQQLSIVRLAENANQFASVVSEESMERSFVFCCNVLTALF